MDTKINYIRGSLMAIALILIVAVLKITADTILPLVIAFFLAGLFTPFTRLCRKHNIPMGIAIILVFCIILAGFFLIVLFLENSAYSIVKEFPKYSQGFTDFARTADAYFMERLGFESPVFSNLNWQQPVLGLVGNLSSYMVSFVSTAGLTFLLMVFILVEQGDLLRKVHHAFPKEGARIARMFSQISARISTYLWIKSILSGVTGLLVYIVARIVGLDFALIWGVLTFLFNFIPSIGSIIISGAVIFMACVQFFPDWNSIIIVAVAITSIQMLVGNILDPRIQGDRLNLSPFLLIVSLIFWGYIWGIVGMFLAVPIMAILQIVCDTVPALKPIDIIISGRRKLDMLDQEEALAEIEEAEVAGLQSTATGGTTPAEGATTPNQTTPRNQTTTPNQTTAPGRSAPEKDKNYRGK